MNDSPSFIRAQIAYDNMCPDEGIEFDPDGKIEDRIRKDLYIILRESGMLWSWDLMDGNDTINGDSALDSCAEAAGDAEREMEKWVAKQMEREQEEAMEDGGP